jgi:hypothetical protein
MLERTLATLRVFAIMLLKTPVSRLSIPHYRICVRYAAIRRVFAYYRKGVNIIYGTGINFNTA